MSSPQGARSLSFHPKSFDAIAGNVWSRYALALAAVVLALLARLLLDSALGDFVPYSLLYAAVTFSAIYLGLGPSIVGTLAGLIGSAVLFVAPRGSVVISGVPHLAEAATYLGVCAIIIIVGEANRRSRVSLNSALVNLQRSEEALRVSGEELERRVGERTEELKRAEERFRDLLESAPDAIVVVNQEGKIELANEQAEELFGYGREELLGRDTQMLVPERLREKHAEERGKFFRESRDRAAGTRLEMYGRRKDGREFPIEVSLSPLITEEGLVVTGAIRDISERRAATEAVRRQAQLLDAANEAILVRSSDDKITYWNRGAERLYGWSRSEALGKSPQELLGADFVGRGQTIEKSPEGGWEGELVQRKRDGTIVTVASRWTTLKDASGKVTGWLEINSDISKRKAAEESARRLGAQVLQMQDDERRRIARELHDSVGQLLSALAINLGQLQSGSKRTEFNERVLADSCQLAQDATNELRTMSHLLHPPLLEELGLASALEWYVEGFSKRSGIATELGLAPDFGRLPGDYEIAIFRIIQECLTNVHRHSGSPRAEVRLTKSAGEVRVEVSDMGKGIPLEKQQSFAAGGAMGVGLRGMRERVAQLGGSMEIHSSEAGTVVTAVLPIELPGESKAATEASRELAH